MLGLTGVLAFPPLSSTEILHRTRRRMKMQAILWVCSKSVCIYAPEQLAQSRSSRIIFSGMESQIGPFLGDPLLRIPSRS
jgi:hypothetical protein